MLKTQPENICLVPNRPHLLLHSQPQGLRMSVTKATPWVHLPWKANKQARHISFLKNVFLYHNTLRPFLKHVPDWFLFDNFPPLYAEVSLWPCLMGRISYWICVKSSAALPSPIKLWSNYYTVNAQINAELNSPAMLSWMQIHANITI